MYLFMLYARFKISQNKIYMSLFSERQKASTQRSFAASWQSQCCG